MKVLFCSRPDALTASGGDTVQMLETQAALRELGHQVDVSLEASPPLQGYDVVHVFNLQTPRASLPQVTAAKRHGVPVALSTIYWDTRPARRGRDSLRLAADPRIAGLARFSPGLAGFVRTAWDSLGSFRADIRRMLELADHLLPNSVAELEILVHDFDYPEARAKATVVPNAVKERPADAGPSVATQEKLAGLPEAFVLEVARVEPTKGQLALIRARDRHAPDLPLVFAGQALPSPYTEEFAERARGARTHFLGPLPQQDLPALYRRARVHALPSLRESPGLATLEAALAGCRCVVAIHAPVQEYFGDDVWICDPEDEASIGRALSAAWSGPGRPELAARIRREFTWQAAAEKTLVAYQRICKAPAH